MLLSPNPSDVALEGVEDSGSPIASPEYSSLLECNEAFPSEEDGGRLRLLLIFNEGLRRLGWGGSGTGGADFISSPGCPISG